MEAGEEAADLVAGVLVRGLPDPPDFMTRLPLVGDRLAALWQQDQHDMSAIVQQSEGVLVSFGQIVVRQMTDLASALGELGYGILLCFQILAAQPHVMAVVRRLAHSLAGEAGEDALRITANAVRVVAVGGLGTAVLESMLSVLGFWLLGLPLAPLLALICFILRLLQIGPWQVWILGGLWLWLEHGNPGAALALVGWVGAIVALGTVLEGRLVVRRVTVPAPILFLAVLGGLVAWGFSGMFLGAAVVSVAWTLMYRWLGLEQAGPEGGSDVDAAGGSTAR